MPTNIVGALCLSGHGAGLFACECRMCGLNPPIVNRVLVSFKKTQKIYIVLSVIYFTAI